MTDIFRGIHRVTTPLPARPSFVHAYLAPLEAGGWMLVDGGIDTPEAWSALSTAVESIAGWDQLKVHVATHMHLDHIGLVHRVRDASSVPFALGVLDAERAAHAAAEPAEEDEYRDQLLARAEAPPPIREALRAASARRRSLTSFVAPDHPLPIDSGPLPFAPEWSVIWTPGHTAGHISLYRESDRCLLAGDAILPTISPTIGVNRQSQDPIRDYLTALSRLEALAPEVILAGHGSEMTGSARIGELRSETLLETQRVEDLLQEEPASAWELSERRYLGRELPLTARIQALRETLAHLEHLAIAGRARRADVESGVRYLAA